MLRAPEDTSHAANNRRATKILTHVHINRDGVRDVYYIDTQCTRTDRWVAGKRNWLSPRPRDALNPKPRPSADGKEVSKNKTSLLQAPPEPDLEGPEESGRGTRTAGSSIVMSGSPLFLNGFHRRSPLMILDDKSRVPRCSQPGFYINVDPRFDLAPEPTSLRDLG